MQRIVRKKNEMSGIVTAHLVYVTAPTDGQKKEMEKFICDKFQCQECGVEHGEAPGTDWRVPSACEWQGV